MNRTIFTLIFALILTGPFTSISGLAEPCGGNNHRKHKNGSYEYIISSWVRTGDNGHYYKTCVENLGHERDFWFDWFIPGPKTYVPPGESATSPRYFTTRESEDWNGCLQYGNHRTTTQEYFIGHKKDQALIEREQSTGCKISRRGSQSIFESTEPLEIDFPVSIFVASDTKDPVGTMLRIDLNVILKQVEKHKAISRITYHIRPQYNSFHGSLSDLHISTNSNRLNEALKAAGFEQGRVAVSKYEGNLTVPLPLPDHYSIGNARYEFFDRHGFLTGSIFVPIPESQGSPEAE